MNDQELRAKMRKAMDSRLSGLKDDPWLAQRVMNRADKEEPGMKKKLRFSVVLVIVTVLVLGTALAVALHTDFYHHVFGNETRENVEAHTETHENGKGGTVDDFYPAQEYVAADPEEAERLIGEQVTSEPVIAQMGDHTLTVLSAVRDENALVMELDLACPTGVRGLNYDRLTNEGKGAWFADDAGYFFIVENAAEKMYVDLKNSSETCLRIYYYCVFFEKLPDGESPVLTAAAVTGDSGPEGQVFDPQQIILPACKAVSAARFAAGDGSAIELSPFSLKVCPVPEAENGSGAVVLQMDPGSLERIVIGMDTGETYTVLEEGKTNNTLYLCGGLGTSGQDISMVLNRLVDPAKVKYIRVDGVEYLPE